MDVARSFGTNPYCAMKQPAGPAADPVPGYSVPPGAGTRRVYVVAYPSLYTSRAVTGYSAPRLASATAVPIVGWPANAVSAARVKIRTRRSVPRASGGNTNVHSE